MAGKRKSKLGELKEARALVDADEKRLSCSPYSAEWVAKARLALSVRAKELDGQIERVGKQARADDGTLCQGRLL